VVTTEWGTFPDELSPSEAMMWKGEDQARLRSGGILVLLLDRSPDWPRLTASFERYSSLFPRLRQRIATTPFGLSPPRWVVDPDFDLSFHLRHVALPPPGKFDQLLELRTNSPECTGLQCRGLQRVMELSRDRNEQLELGKARIARPGTDVTVVAWSAAVQVALQAAEDAQAQGISVEVIDLRTLVPLDVSTLAESVTRTGRAVVIQEAPLTAGFGAEVVATIQEEAFFSLQAPIRRVAAPDVPYPVQLLEEAYAPNAERVLEAILSTTRD